jgi:hypothetical protein
MSTPSRPSGHEALAGGGTATSGAATRAELERTQREAAARGVGVLTVEREHLKARQAQYWTNLRAAEALVAAGGRWVYRPGSSVPEWVAPPAERLRATQEAADAAAQNADRRTRWREYVGAGRNVLDQYGEVKRALDANVVEEWFA